MTRKRFVLLVCFAFLGAFFWAGGANLIPKQWQKTTLPSALSHPASLFGIGASAASPEETKENTDSSRRLIEQGSSLYHRLYRIVALKQAVEAKLDRKNYIKIQEMPLSFQQALIAVEDNRFYRHYGFDIEGILRATLVNIQTGNYTEGGSTITQQLIKNLFLNQDKNFGRKAEEFILAIDMELRYSKEEILEMYANTIYFGSGAYGIKSAAKIYFDRPPADLTLAQSSLLAGLPNAPSLYSPFVDFTAAKQRQAVVLNVMAKNGYIGPSMAQEALAAPLHLNSSHE
ncbi:MAG: transglycosylase domain-containing protein [Sporomusaceae bacterium]|nr:transglycosylase domain-containing protein [Sporomusaceae bacterium]